MMDRECSMMTSEGINDIAGRWIEKYRDRGNVELKGEEDNVQMSQMPKYEPEKMLLCKRVHKTGRSIHHRSGMASTA